MIAALSKRTKRLLDQGSLEWSDVHGPPISLTKGGIDSPCCDTLPTIALSFFFFLTQPVSLPACGLPSKEAGQPSWSFFFPLIILMQIRHLKIHKESAVCKDGRTLVLLFPA